MAQMTVIYQAPADQSAFDAHYFNVHIPLAKKLPGLLSYKITKAPIISTTGHNDVYLIGHLFFENMEALKQAFSSEIDQQCAADRRILAPNPDDVQIYIYETIVT